MISNVRLIARGGAGRKDEPGNRLYIDGQDISDKLAGVKVDVDSNDLPEVTLKLLALPFEYNGDADVKYDFTPRSIREALALIKNEIIFSNELYDKFVDIIVSTLKTASIDAANVDEEIVQKIIYDMVSVEV